MILIRNDVVKALKKVGGVISAKDPLSFLSGVRFAPGKIMATNLRQNVIVELPGSNLDALVNFKTFQELIKKSKDEELEIEVIDDRVIVNSEEYTASCVQLDPSLFPPIEYDQKQFKPVPPELSAALGMCSDSTSTDPTRYGLTGIHIVDKYVESTDGHRMSRVTMSQGGLPEMILPMDSVDLFMDLGAKDYYVDEAERLVWFRGEGAVFSTTLIESKFPAVENVIPQKSDSIMNHVLTDDVFVGTEIVGVFDDSEAKGTEHRVRITIGTNLLKIKSQNSQGEIIFNREIDYDGAAVEFDVNMKYLESALKGGESELYLYEHPTTLMIVSGFYMAVLRGIED